MASQKKLKEKGVPEVARSANSPISARPVCASAVQDSMATAVSMGRILSVMVIFAAALPPAAGLATPAVLETVAVRGVASGGLRVAEGNADTIDSGMRSSSSSTTRSHTPRQPVSRAWQALQP